MKRSLAKNLLNTICLLALGAAGQMTGAQVPGSPGQPGGGLQTNQQGAAEGPIVVPPISFVDVAGGRFGKLFIDLEAGQFAEGAVDRLRLLARQMDLSRGTLQSLDIDVNGGHFADFTCDRLTLSTAGELSFDTGAFLNRRMLQFTYPAKAKVTALVSEASLNRFLKAPATRQHLSLSALGSNSILGTVFGALNQVAGNNFFGLTFSDASLSLQPANRVIARLVAQVGAGNFSTPLPLTCASKLALKDGWIYLYDTHITASGQELGPDLANLVAGRVNSLAQWGARSDDIHFIFTELKVVPGDRLVLTGTAEVKRLRFGRQ